ncbi:group II truncated hemoglobin [Acidothermaceae bacterium B102]|nr:group II truncated hemoglobin [Acidothermaceae bacterium B102]
MYEAAGGEAGFSALVAAHHQRCLDDPELNHPFSHGGDPDHLQHLAGYLGEVFGGPPVYSQSYGGQSFMLTMHADQGMEDDLGRRFVQCFVQAADDAGLPDDPELRGALKAYMEWAVADVYRYNAPGSSVAAGQPMPHWSWDGLQH